MNIILKTLKKLPTINKIMISIIVIINFFIQICNVSVPFVFQKIVDNLNDKNSFYYFRTLLYIYLLLLFLNLIFGVLYTKNIYEISSYYKKKGFDFLVRKNKTINNPSEMADLLYNLSENGMTSIFYESNINFIAYIIFYFILLFIVFKASKIIGLLLSINIIILYVASKLKIIYLLPLNSEIIKSESEMIEKIEDTLRGFVEIKFFKLLNGEMKKINSYFNEILIIIKQKQKVELIISILEMISFSIFPITLYIIGLLFVKNMISIGEGVKIIQMVEIALSYSMFISSYTNVVPEIISVFKKYNENFQEE
ncbi:hypothetical protein SAMN02745164_02248 [Marinitoga hydrogenitolerans DSM 16785]|uniref:ABC transmembrane type-1 domain-containing protein n=1 Tax=Marinitoga hydrogenitolerans (strain DSM 16785 / JCM 12826 / AT1271) TaxID=1122195 RepID=A0A1M5ARU8_MARH1|nr:ABC transporter ATP-binding protein [Marinitoga hydrogenitolerans]SHF32652.1 hypothetical protein SAMN02745164_02248 [Marinitoga hydrogenitolerans DSM 16785]